jgi:hypothetical protein
VAAPPVQPVPGVAWWGRVAEQAPGFGDGERNHPGVGGRRLIREYRCGCLGAGTAAQQGGGDGADGRSGHDQHGVPGDRGIQADLGLVEPEAVLSRIRNLPRRASAARPRGLAGTGTPAGRRAGSSSERRARRWSGGGGSAGDAAGRRCPATPSVPALPLGSGPGRADLPAAPAQPGSGLLAGQRDTAGQDQPEAARDPQHVGLIAVLQVLAQLGARAIDLIAAHEVQPHAIGERPGENVEGQLALGAEH